MRFPVKWYSIVVTILFIGQAMLLLVLLQPQPHMAAQKAAQVPVQNDYSPSPSEPQVCEEYLQVGGDVQSMAYIYNKYRIAATEVKRQVLKRKGEHVPEVPPKASPLCSSNLIAATYNLWNINPPWTTRAVKIAGLIDEIQPDFVGIQEIRKYEGRNQLDLLKELLPEYKHSLYEKVQNEQKGEEEGLGILSKHPIIESSSINFGNTNRKCLRALIQTPLGKVNFFVTHFSLNDIEQCTHALLLWDYVNSFPAYIPQILVGDMNTYFDFEWPMDLLTQGLTSFTMGPFNPCSSVMREILDANGVQLQPQQEQLQQKRPRTLSEIPELRRTQGKRNHTLNFHLLKDVWDEVYPAIPKSQALPTSGRWWGTWPAPPGHTFSNYGDQDPSRTDRMYFYSPDTKDSTLKICDVSLFGDTPFTEDNKQIYPSDHKGVAGYFQWESKK